MLTGYGSKRLRFAQHLEHTLRRRPRGMLLALISTPVSPHKRGTGMKEQWNAYLIHIYFNIRWFVLAHIADPKCWDQHSHCWFISFLLLSGNGGFLFIGHGTYSLAYYGWGKWIYVWSCHWSTTYWFYLSDLTVRGSEAFYNCINSLVTECYETRVIINWNVFLFCFDQILPVSIKGLAGSVATMANFLTSWGITMTANLLLGWSSGGHFFHLRHAMSTYCVTDQKTDYTN